MRDKRYLSPTQFAIVSATLIIAHQTAGKATRDAVFLSQFAVTELPKMVIGAAVLSMAAVFLISYLLTRFGPSRVIPSAFALSAAGFAADYFIYPAATDAIAVLLYLQMAVFGAVLVSGFWSVVNEQFDPHTAKQTIARIAAAATLGGVIGGILADRVPAMFDVRTMLIVLAALHLSCVISVAGIGRIRTVPAVQEDFSVLSGIRILVRTRYLLLMGLLMVLAAALAALIDYAFKAGAAASVADSESLAAFFGRFYAIVGVATFIVQTSFGPGILRRFGIGATLAVMPAVVLLMGAVNLLVPRLWTAVMLRACQLSLSNSFFRSGFELLYTPLAPATKRPTKTLVDVASDRLGDMIGGGVLLLMLAVLSNLRTFVVVVVAMSLAVVALFVISRLYRGYVDQLAASLYDGSISLRKDDVVDATTRQTLAEISGSAEREQLMSRIKARKRTRLGLSEEAAARAADDSSLLAHHESNEELLARAMADLTSGQIDRRRRCLHGEFMDVRLVPFIIPLLGVDSLAEDARMELRWHVPNTIGTLTDAMLDPDMPLLVRQRIPGVLEASHNPRVVQALLDGLQDDEFNVRYSCARALGRMRKREPTLPIPAELVFGIIRKEVNVDADIWRRREFVTHVDLAIDIEAAPIETVTGADYSLEHVFSLLSLVFNANALWLSFRAISGRDRALLGTALEYLENILPDDIYQALRPNLGQSAARPVSKRRRAGELLDELRQSTAGLGSTK